MAMVRMSFFCWKKLYREARVESMSSGGWEIISSMASSRVSHLVEDRHSLRVRGWLESDI